MVEWPNVSFENIGVVAGSCLATVLTVLGIQKKVSKQTDDGGDGLVPTAHGKDRAEVRALQDRCRDLENSVTNLKEKLDDYKEDLDKAERKHDAAVALLFAKLDTMNDALTTIKIAVGVVEGHGKH